ncbi:MAG: zinc dependent phospholipase C family protein, partial [Flammeovirgaceae bacterium]|nr:zinc dependent phospholipase C family protein [Flammeovirgaceae bacterium]
EAPRHYIDLDHFGDSAAYKMPRYWKEAVAQYSEDTLKAYGILPWHVLVMHYRLRDAFLERNPDKIVTISAELGHYIADAHVPLHTTENYNGQLTGQEGIHGFWESRLPELFSNDYDFFVGNATYIEHPQLRIWGAIIETHLAVDSVLRFEKELAEKSGEKKYTFESKGKQTVKVYSQVYAKEYHKMLNGMVEKQMKSAIKCIGDFWFTAWIDAGQPDIKSLIDYKPTEEELAAKKKEVEVWKEARVKARAHE